MHPIEPEELMAYLDGEAGTPEAGEHVERCRECQAMAADLHSISRRLLDWQVEEVNPRVERAVSAERATRRVRPAWRRGLVWGGGLAAVCAVLVFMAPMLRKQAVETVWTNGQNTDDFGTVLKARVPSRGVSVDLYKARAPQIVRTTTIVLTTPTFAKSRASLDEILRRQGGHVANLSVITPTDAGQTLQARLRIPGEQLDSAIAEIRNLGQVETEQQGGEEVTAQVVDIEARLSNARNTERRLVDILRRSTGKIADVLTVEKEIDRVRGEIERMEAEHKSLADRISFATLDVTIHQEYKTRGPLGHSAAEGFRTLGESFVSAATFLLSYGPALIVWAALLFFPVRYVWRKLRKHAL